MITEFHARNILSLRDVSLRFRTKLTALVGSHASGKSNIVKAMYLLKLLLEGKGIRDAITELVETSTKLPFKFDTTRPITLGFTAKVEANECMKLTYELSFRCDREVVEHEVLKLNGQVVAEFRLVGDSSGTLTIYTPSEITQSTTFTIDYPQILDSLSVVTKARRGLESRVVDMVPLLRRCLTVHHFSPESIRSGCELTHITELSYDGSNLASVLHTLLTTNRRKFLEIEKVLQSLIPEVDELATPVHNKNVYIAFRDKSIGDLIPPELVSDGTLRLLAFIIALYLGKQVVVFEEPENCVHPWLYRTLIDLFRKAPCQVIFTTHSPYVLDLLNPEELVIVEKINGETKVRRVDNDPKLLERVRKLLTEGIPLGEVWYSGELGGTP